MDNDTTMAGSGEETKSIQKQVYEPRGRVGRRFYADVHRSADGGRRARPHAVFDGHRCVMTARLVDVPVAEGDEVYLDVVHPAMYDNVSALLSRGVRVFR